MSGLYGLVLLVKTICQLHNVQHGMVKVACDNSSAIRVFEPDYIPNTKYSNFDLTSATFSILKECPIIWVGVHVEGHQDKGTPLHSLSRLARLNVQMDSLAKSYWQHLVTSSPGDAMPLPTSHPIYGEEWQLWAGDTKISDPNSDNLYAIIQDPVTHQWWVRHNHTTATAQALTDWDATEAMMKALPLPRRRWVTKNASENCGVGTTMVKWRLKESAECPRCTCPEEDTAHVQRCNGNGAKDVWTTSMESFKKYMEKEFTHPLV